MNTNKTILRKTLSDIGLSEKEALVYTEALSLGDTSILKISTKTNIKRSTVYPIVESLIEKGLMSIVQTASPYPQMGTPA